MEKVRTLNYTQIHKFSSAK